jgi:NAD(P)-dependent dehydrogenase (short-subunit alcohol dehydrogenase family)
MIINDLSGKVALITGATRGIGKAIASKLLKAGATVIVTGTTQEGSAPAGCQYKAVNFLEQDELVNFAYELEQLDIDILVNNAGINKVSPFAEIELDDFEAIQQVNVHAPFILCKAVLPKMKIKRWGRIVNISSIWGKISKEYRGSYGASKFALDGMTAALAAEVAQYNILANSIAPGFVDTELTREVLGDKGIAELIQQVPARRLGTTEEIAEFVYWLASPLNTYISGQNIAIDGGFSRV